MKRAYLGRPHKFKATKAVIFIILVGWISMMAWWYIESIQIKIAYADAADRVSVQSMVIAAQKANLSEALKQRLGRTAKIETDNTTKQIVKTYLKQYFGDQEQVAEKVFTCESNLQPRALNTNNPNKSSDRGVAQINSVHAGQFKQVTGQDYTIFAHDIETNIKFAKWLYDRQGFRPWVCSEIVGVKI